VSSKKSKQATILHNNINTIIAAHPLLFTVLLAFGMSVFLYWDHISTGIPLFMTASDGWGQAWPYRAALSDYIRTEGFPQWHFGIGLGNPLASFPFGSLFEFIPFLLGRAFIPSVMVWMQISKIVTACLFFYLFAKKMGFHHLACTLIALMYAFSGHMILRGGNWVSYGTEAVLVAFLLYSVETYFRDGKWKLLPIAIFLIGISFSPYYLYLYSLLLIVYGTVRFLHIRSFNFKNYAIHLGKCAIFWGIGVLMAALFWVITISAMLSSHRAETTLDRIDLKYILNILINFNAQINLSAFFRFFSTDVLGAGWQYSGVLNMLEGPLNYMGLVPILLIPVFFYFADKKLRRFSLFGFSMICLYFLSPLFRNILNLFVSPIHFKLSGMWMSILLLVMAGYTISALIKSYESDTKKITGIFAFSWSGILVLFLGAIPFLTSNDMSAVSRIVIYIVILLTVYAFLFYKYCKQKATTLLMVLLAVVILEATLFSHITIQDKFCNVARPHFSNLGSFDFLEPDDAVITLNQMDGDFFRTFLARPHDASFSPTRPLAYGYFGSTAYDGFMNLSYIRFMNALGLDSRSLGQGLGLRFRPMLRILTAHKYTIVSPGGLTFFGDTYLFTVGNNRVYKNNYYLPLGFAYDSFITYEQFSAIQNPIHQDLMLLSTVVLDNPHTSIHNYDMSIVLSAQSYQSQIEITRANEAIFHHATNIQGELPSDLRLTSTGDDPFVVIPIDNNYIHNYVISVDITSLDSDTLAQIFWGTPTMGINEASSHKQNISQGQRTTVTVLVDNINLTQLRIDPGTTPGDFIIENLTITAIDNSPIYDIYTQAVIARRTEAFQMDYFSHNYITGTIETFGNRILFFSIPHARGWRMYINGERVPIETVNIGFIGATIEEGVHHVELRFRLPGLITGGIISLIGFAVYVGFIILDKRGKIKFSSLDNSTLSQRLKENRHS